MKKSKFTIKVSFTVPDQFNNPGYWDSYEGEDLIIYEGPSISKNELVKLIAKGEFDKDFKINNEILDSLGYNFSLEDLSKIATKCKDAKEFNKLASKNLFESFDDDLSNASDVLDDGEKTIPNFKKYYKIRIN